MRRSSSLSLLLSGLIGRCGLTEQKLQFVLWDGSVPDAAPSKRTLSPEDLSQQLDRLLLEDMASDEQIFDWVEVRRDWSRWCRRWGGVGGALPRVTADVCVQRAGQPGRVPDELRPLPEGSDDGRVQGSRER